MLFHEIYGVYFRTVADILRQASAQPLSPGHIRQIVAEKAFGESALTIPDALLSGKWPLLDETGRSVLKNPPETGITLLEKRWLKSLLMDPRIALFDPPTEGLANIQPLYDPGQIVWFDRYTDGDPYEDPQYIAHFRLLLTAIREKRRVQLCYNSGKGNLSRLQALPLKLEYSEKDDKFRLRALAHRGITTLNVARIRELEMLAPAEKVCALPAPESRLLVLELTDRRNALERVLLHFSHLKKETIRLDEEKYLLKLWYSPEDEREMLIRVLSFGPVVKVTEPAEFVSQIRARIRKQMDMRAP